MDKPRIELPTYNTIEEEREDIKKVFRNNKEWIRQYGKPSKEDKNGVN